jgi:hypothetical protein
MEETGRIGFDDHMNNYLGLDEPTRDETQPTSLSSRHTNHWLG